MIDPLRFWRNSRRVIQLACKFSNLDPGLVGVFDTERGYTQVIGQPDAPSVHLTIEIAFFWGDGRLEIVRVDPHPGTRIISFNTRYCGITAETWHESGIAHIPASESREWVRVRLERAQIMGGWTGREDLTHFDPPISVSEFPAYHELSDCPSLLTLLRAEPDARLGVVSFAAAAFGWVVQALPNVVVMRGYRPEARCVLPNGRVSADMRAQNTAHNVAVDSLMHFAALALPLQIVSLYLPVESSLADIRAALISPIPDEHLSALYELYPFPPDTIERYRPGKPKFLPESRPVFPGPSLIVTGFRSGWQEMDSVLTLLPTVIGRGPSRILFTRFRLQLWFTSETDASLLLATVLSASQLSPYNFFIAPTGHLNPAEPLELIESLQTNSWQTSLPFLPQTSAGVQAQTSDTEFFSPTTPEELNLPWFGARLSPTWARPTPPEVDVDARALRFVFTTNLERGTIYESDSFSWSSTHTAHYSAFRRGRGDSDTLSLPTLPTDSPHARNLSSNISHPAVARPQTTQSRVQRQPPTAARTPPVQTLEPPPEWPGRDSKDMVPVYKLVQPLSGQSWLDYSELFIGHSWHKSGGNSKRYNKQRTRRVFSHILDSYTLTNQLLRTLGNRALCTQLLGDSEVTAETLDGVAEYIRPHLLRLSVADPPTTPTPTLLDVTTHTSTIDQLSYDYQLALHLQDLDQRISEGTSEPGPSQITLGNRDLRETGRGMSNLIEHLSEADPLERSGQGAIDPPGWVREEEEDVEYIGKGKGRA